MRRLFALWMLLILLFSTQPARAQGGPSLSSVDVWIWPEYDKPSVLVIYHILVAPQTALPVTLTFRIPSAVQRPHTVAVGDAPNTVTDQNVEFSLKQAGDWINVNVKATGPAITLEYYDPSLTVNGTSRQFTYLWPGDYSVGSFTVRVQQPYDASRFQSEPTLEEAGTLPDRLTYYESNFGALTQGEAFTLNMGYEKASDSLSIDLMPVEPSAPVDANTAGRVSLKTYLPWLLGGFGVLVIAGGLYFYFRGQPRPRQVRKRHAAGEEPVAGQTYCHQCGTRSRPGDRFCRSCGTRLRMETEE